jgi:DNA-binding CsgD family transcriptional regulator
MIRSSPFLSNLSRWGNRIDLTAREREILELFSRGLQNKVVATQLSIAEGTVKAHARSMYRKLYVTNRVQAILAFHDLLPFQEDASYYSILGHWNNYSGTPIWGRVWRLSDKYNSEGVLRTALFIHSPGAHRLPLHHHCPSQSPTRQGGYAYADVDSSMPESQDTN